MADSEAEMFNIMFMGGLGGTVSKEDREALMREQAKLHIFWHILPIICFFIGIGILIYSIIT